MLAKYQEKWRYLHVDEYQDTNRAQYLWVRALAAQAPQPARRRRRRPVDLLVARRRPAQHPRLRARLARHGGRQARAELPLDAADPRRRPRGRLAQQRAQGQEAVDRQRRRDEDPALRGLQRGGGGRVDRPPGRGPDRRSWDDADPPGRRGGRALPGARHRGDVPDERPVPRDRGIVPALRPALPARRRDRGSTPGARSRTPSPTCASCARTPTASASSGSSTSRRAGSATRPSRRCAPPRRTRGRDDVGRDRGGASPASSRPWRRGRGTPWPSSRRSCGGCGRGSGCCALPELLDEALEASGYRAMLADGSEDGEERWANLLELRAVTTRYDDLDARRRARPAARGDGARRRPGFVRGRRGRRDAHHAPRRERPRIPGRLHRRARGRPLPAQPGAR